MTGNYCDLINKPEIPSAQIQSDWAQTNTNLVDYIKNKPTIGNATITFTQSKGAFFLDEVKVISTSTGIKDVKAVTTTTTRIYTIDGRYVGTDPNQLPRGLYVVNGKKIVK